VDKPVEKFGLGFDWDSREEPLAIISNINQSPTQTIGSSHANTSTGKHEGTKKWGPARWPVPIFKLGAKGINSRRL
jgi:hypothetical protein